MASWPCGFQAGSTVIWKQGVAAGWGGGAGMGAEDRGGGEMLHNTSPEFQKRLTQRLLEAGVSIMCFDGFEIGLIGAKNKGELSSQSRKSMLSRHLLTAGESRVLTFNSRLR